MKILNAVPFSEAARQKSRFPQANNQGSKVDYSQYRPAADSFFTRNEAELKKLADTLNYPQQ